MIEITETTVIGKVHQDYIHNYMPRKEINLRLSFDEMKEFLKDEWL